MSSSYRIPTSSTDVFEFEAIVDSSTQLITVPKVDISRPSEASTAQAAVVGDVSPVDTSGRRALVGLVTAVYLGLHPVVRDERMNRVWACVAETNETSQRLSRADVIEQALRRVLSCMPAYEMQDGMTLPLGINLAEWIKDFGERGLGKLASVALTTDANPEALSHALRWMGRIEDTDSVHGRLRLLVEVLKAPSASVRDGAALGLVELGSPLAIGALERAALSETNDSLRSDLEQAAEYLKQSS